MAVHPAQFIREVRAEMARVTWPSRRETLVTTALVVAMVAVMAAFFFSIDEVVSIAVRAMFGAAS
ncbi:MAG: preprotein translocase subunit SecE [Acetobacteraceae bacterium]